MTLNAENCEVAFFTMNLHGPLRFAPLPKFLGVTLEHSLLFGQHVANITAKAAGKCRVLTSPTSKQWGWRKSNLLVLYLSVHMERHMEPLPGNPGYLQSV